MLSCQLRYVAVSWPWCVPLCTCCSCISWHMVAQRTWVSTMCSGLLGCTYHLISINQLHTNCDIMRHLLLFGGSMWCTMDILYFVYMIQLNCVHMSPWTLLLYGHQFIGTPVHPDFSTFHVYSMMLQYYHSSSSWRFTVSSVLLHCVEPFLISWLPGHYVMLWSQSWILSAYLPFQYCSIHVHAQ